MRTSRELSELVQMLVTGYDLNTIKTSFEARGYHIPMAQLLAYQAVLDIQTELDLGGTSK